MRGLVIKDSAAFAWAWVDTMSIVGRNAEAIITNFV